MIDAALLAIELLVLILLLRQLRLSSKKDGLMSLGIFAYPDEHAAQDAAGAGKKPGKKRHA